MFVAEVVVTIYSTSLLLVVVRPETLIKVRILCAFKIISNNAKLC